MIENLEKPDLYHNNKSFIYSVVVKNVDGSPVTGSTKKAKITFQNAHRYWGQVPSEPGISFEAPVDEKGIATFQVTLPENDSRFYRIVATFGGSESHIGTISKFEPTVQSSEPIKIQVNTKT